MTIETDIKEGAGMLMYLMKTPYLEFFKTGGGKYTVINSPEAKTFKVFKTEHTSTGTKQTLVINLSNYQVIIRFTDPMKHDGVLIYLGRDEYLIVCRAVLSFRVRDFPDLNTCKSGISEGDLLIFTDEIYLEFTHTGRFRISVWNCVGSDDILRENLTFRLISL